MSQNSVRSNCLSCGAETQDILKQCFDTRFGLDQIFDICLCPRCGLEQTWPRPSADELGRYYAAYYNFGGESGTRYTSARERFLSSPLYRLWLYLDGDISFHARRGRGRLLDFGCNEGRGLARYAASGYDAEGFEVNERAAAVARHAGFVVHSGTLADLQPADPYDVVVLSNVLEHALQPAEMLQDVRHLLRPGGQVWISCPNSESWLRVLFGRFWINWHVPFHITHFSKTTLRHSLEQNGFELLEIRTETPALWVTQSILARLYATPGKSTRELRSVVRVLPLLITVRCFLFPLLWLGNLTGKGDCLVVFARKTAAKR